MIAHVRGEEMTSDEHTFHLVHELVVREGDDEVCSARLPRRGIPRDHV